MTATNLELSEEQDMILDQVRKLVQDQIEPSALEQDEERRFAKSNLEQLAELGMLGLPIAEASGGVDMGMLSFAVAIEELARSCGSTARLLLSQAGLCAKALEGLPAASTTCEALVGGEQLGAYVGPWSGVVATPDGDSWGLDGTAAIVTAAAEADVILIAATAAADAEPLLFVAPASNVTRAAASALGFRAAGGGSIQLTQAKVGGEALVARGAEAAAAIERAWLAAMIGGGAIGVGLAANAVERSVTYTKDRLAFGKPLSAQQAVRHKLVEATRRAAAARHLVYHAARTADAGGETTEAAALCRLEGVAAAVLASDEAIQVHGGYGYTTEYHVERHYRDAKTLEVMDGGAEALLDLVGAQLVD
ncbi:MAG: acyl-CoA dehydrogenase family protein [Planctomycetota bacterium]